MSTKRSIDELASVIASETAKYSHYLRSQQLPLPSHDPIPHLPPGQSTRLPAEIEEARKIAMEAAFDLYQLLVGPMKLIFNVLDDSLEIVSLQFINKLKIHSLFPTNTNTTYKAIADACALDEDDTRRLMRLAMTHHFFQETEEGLVAHTAATQMLQANSPVSTWVGSLTGDNWISMTRGLVETMRKFPGSQNPAETAYCQAHGFMEDPWKEWPKFPGRVERFAEYLKMLNQAPSTSPKHLIKAYSFAAIPKDGVLVDVGGSIGVTSVAIATAFPHLRFVIQDRPETIALRSPLDPELQERFTFMAHDFFTEQPVKGADVYYFRLILHDWSDTYCVKILRSLIPALKKGSKVLVSDICLPRTGALPVFQERSLRGMDMMMKSFSNGKERDAEEWKNLFAVADPRFRVCGIMSPPLSDLSIIEVE